MGVRCVAFGYASPIVRLVGTLLLMLINFTRDLRETLREINETKAKKRRAGDLEAGEAVEMVEMEREGSEAHSTGLLRESG
jgi:hypothetical protein